MKCEMDQRRVSLSAVSAAHCGGDSTFMTICTPESWFGNSDLWVHKQLGCWGEKNRIWFVLINGYLTSSLGLKQEENSISIQELLNRSLRLIFLKWKMSVKHHVIPHSFPNHIYHAISFHTTLLFLIHMWSLSLLPALFTICSVALLH